MDKRAVLVNALHDKTIAGGIKWEEGFEDNTYTASFPNYSVGISFEEDDEGITTYYLAIYNPDGKEIDRIYAMEIYGDLHNANDMLRTMYNLARRHALGVEDALDSILGELGVPPF